METFDELLNTNDFLDLPNELLDASSYVKIATPIKSPDSSSHYDQILTQPIQIPTEVQATQNVESVLEQKSDDQKLKVLKTLDVNTNSASASGRPKRAAALAANSSICSMKRKISSYTNNENNENESDKENVEQGDQKPKAKQIKRRKTASKKTSPEIQDKSQNISKSQDVSDENIELKESEVVDFLTQRKSLAENNPVLTQKVNLENNQNVHMTLHLSCESDPEYDFNNNIVEKPDQNDLSSKLLYPNLCNPKLSDFVVNKPLNNSENSNSNSVLHTPVKIDKSAVYTVSDHLYYDDSNYEKDELGFTLTRAVEPDLEQHKTHVEYHMDIESEVQALLQDNNIQVTDENNNVKNNEKSLMYEGVDLMSLDNGKTSDELIGFAYNVAKVLFSKEELAEGIFPTKNGTSRSKSRLPLDNHRTQILKEAVIKKFEYSPDSTEAIWTSIRSDLNKKLSAIKR